MEPDQVDTLLSLWSERLNLGAWRIQWKIKEKLSIPGALMEICPTRNRRIAVIGVREDVMNYEQGEFEPLLVHELVHLIFDPLAEEHLDQMKFIESGVRLKEYKFRFVKVLERTVEQISVALHERLLIQNTMDQYLQTCENAIMALPDSVIVMDQMSDIRFANTRAVAMFGYSQIEFMNQRLAFLMSANDRELFRKRFKTYVIHHTEAGSDQLLHGILENIQFFKKETTHPLSIEARLSTFESLEDGLCFTTVFQDIIDVPSLHIIA